MPFKQSMLKRKTCLAEFSFVKSPFKPIFAKNPGYSQAGRVTKNASTQKFSIQYTRKKFKKGIIRNTN